MSKPAALFISRCRILAGMVCIAFLSLLPLVPASTLAAVADPVLQRSEQIDLQRLGKVSSAERAVLRVEWRSAMTGVDESRTLQDMLDRLRNIEGTVDEVSRLIRGIPAQKPIVATVAPEVSNRFIDDKTLALAGTATAGLLALWWFSTRRKSEPRPATARHIASAETSNTVGASKTSPPAVVPPLADAATLTKPVPQDQPLPESATPAEPASTQPRTENTAIEFSLEEADPESIARAHAKLQQLQVKPPVHVPAKTQGTGASVEPTLELAEIMLSMGLEQGAAQTLIEYTEANPRQALHHWLKLLDIHRNSGQIEDFKETAEKLRRNFNIQAEDWARSAPHDAPTLEGFPRLADQIQQLWLRPEECIAYLKNLLEDNRDGARAGFPRSVAEEILLLIDILKTTSAIGQGSGENRSTT